MDEVIDIQKIVAERLGKQFNAQMIESAKPLLGDYAEHWAMFLPEGTYRFSCK